MNNSLYRELATQIFDVFNQFLKGFPGLRCTLFMGGTSVAESERDFLENGAQVYFHD
jgi:superfamily II DNA/RNA helicase